MTTFLIALGFALVVLFGNVWYAKKNAEPVNWKRGAAMAACSFIIIALIGWLSE